MSFVSRLWNAHNCSEGDNPELSAYAGAMAGGQPYIQLKLEVPGAIELGDFVGAFTALASEYERFNRGDAPEGKRHEASLYVEQVRQGSILAVLIPVAVGVFPDLVTAAGQALDLEEFVRRYGHRLSRFLGRSNPDPGDLTKSELRDFSEQVAAIAATPNSTIEVAAIEIENGEHKVKAAFKFSTPQAREIQDKVEVVKQQLDHKSGAEHERVTMIFTRSDVRGAQIGKRSGELVEIESISDKSLPLIYASELAEQAIKHEIADAEDNVYKKGFVVDVNVETVRGKAVAYRVTHLHQVIDLD